MPVGDSFELMQCLRLAHLDQDTAGSSAAVEESKAEFQAAADVSVEAQEAPPESLVRIELAKLDS